MRNNPPTHHVRDRQAIGWETHDAERREDAVRGSYALLEAQVRYHQYPCKIAGEE